MHHEDNNIDGGSRQNDNSIEKNTKGHKGPKPQTKIRSGSYEEKNQEATRLEVKNESLQKKLHAMKTMYANLK